MSVIRIKSIKLRSALRSIRRRVTRRGKRNGRPSPNEEKWWDGIYQEHTTFAASGHYGITEEENCQDFEIRRSLLASILDRYRRPGSERLLDAGCGNGLFTREFVKMGFQVTALDFSREALRRAKRLVDAAVRWRRNRIESFHFRRPFAFVVCLSVLMCYTSDEEHRNAVRNLASHVRPRGHLVIEELLAPAGGNGTQPRSKTVFRFRSLGVYQRLAEELGFELVEYVPFHIPAAGQDKCFLVFQRRGSRLNGSLGSA